MTSKDLINIFWLGVNQGGNALFPLLLMPWLLITLGSNDFSRLVLAEVVAFYILSLSLYSFDVTQLRAVATAFQSDDKRELARIFYLVTLARFSLFAMAGLILWVVVYYTGLEQIFLVWLLFPLGLILQHNYFFLGCAQNKLLALVVFICRCCALFLLFWLHSQQQLTLQSASLIAAGSYLLSGIVASVVLICRLPFIGLPHITSVIALLRSGTVVFSGNMAVTLYRNSNVLVLGLFASPHAVSVYAIAEKYIRMFQALARPLNDHYYAKIAARLDQAAIQDSFAAIRQSTRPQLLFLFFSGMTLCIIAAGLFLSGQLPIGVTDVVVLLMIMSVAVLFGVVNFMYGVVGLNNLGYDHYMTKSLVLVGCLSLVICCLAVFVAQQYGAAFAFVFAEMLLSILIFIKIRQVIRD